MKEVFADTFYFLALLNPSDEAYSQVQKISVGQGRRLITTAWVLTELANALSKQSLRARFISTFTALKSTQSVEIIGPDQRLFDAGVQLYEVRPDKDWSLTYCISFVVMKERGTTEALTGDRHFEHAGFRALLS